MVDIDNRMKNLHEVCESKSMLPNEEKLQGMLSSAAESAAVATASAFLINSADQKGIIHLQSENERLNEKLELSQIMNWGFVGLFTPILFYSIGKLL